MQIAVTEAGRSKWSLPKTETKTGFTHGCRALLPDSLERERLKRTTEKPTQNGHREQKTYTHISVTAQTIKPFFHNQNSIIDFK